LSSETLSSETLSSELISIVGRKTASELEIILIQNQLDLIRSKIDNLIKMLGGWIKP